MRAVRCRALQRRQRSGFVRRWGSCVVWGIGAFWAYRQGLYLLYCCSGKLSSASRSESLNGILGKRSRSCLLDTLSIFGAKYLFIVIGGIALVYFLKQPRSRRKRIVIFAALTLPLTYIVSKIGALLYNDPRPFVAGHFIPLIPHEPDNGFPSDHVLLCAGIAALIYPSSRSLSL